MPTKSSSAKRVRAFQSEHAGDDNESKAVTAALAHHFEDRANGELPDQEDDEEVEDLGDLLGELREQVTEGVLATVPAPLRTLAAFMLFEDYAEIGDREWSLYGIAEFEDANDEESILGDMKASGGAPGGVFTFGEELFLDTLGEVKGKKGAVLRATGFNLDGAKVLAPSLSAFLSGR